MKYWCLLVLSSVVLFSCNRQSTPNKEEPLVMPEVPLTDSSTLVSIDTMAIQDTIQDMAPHLVLRYEKTSCYGRCPSYIFKVYSNGDVTYEGRRHVDHVGMHLGTIPINQVDSLQEKASDIDIFSLSDVYPENGKTMVDFPNTLITYIADGQEKKIKDNHLAPAPLAAFEKWIEQLAHSVSWALKVE
jgi:hypothetical protein